MTKEDHSQKSGNNAPLDLSALTDFQFGPAWARGGASGATFPAREMPARPAARERRFSRESADGGERRSERRPFNRDNRGREQRDYRERREGRDNREGRRQGDRGPREMRPVRELPEPTAGLRVELRPVDSVLTVFSSEVHKQKRAVSLLEMAKVVMGAKERFDLVFMKQEGGPELIHSKKGDGACWIEKEESVAYLWQSPWFDELYEAVDETVEAPKGVFSAIAKCGFSGQLIGPVNWHGYQSAVMALHRSKFSNMPFEKYRSRIVIEKGDEVVAAWLEQATKKTVWKPKREGAEETVLADEKAVEKDFCDFHFDEVYEVVDKVFVNGATPRRLLAPGLGAHLAILSDKTRKFPQMLIPNLCHGMARHHMPIYKWSGGHYTGPSRPKCIPEGTVLADRMMAIASWVKENSGQTVDKLLASLSGVAVPGEDADAEAKEQAAAAHDPYVADMIWLMEQGFILVMNDNTVWNPKNDAAKDQQQKEKSASSKKKKQGSRKTSAQSKEAKAAELKAEQAAEEEDPVQAEAAADEQAVEVSEPEAEDEPAPVAQEAEVPAEQPVEPAEVEVSSSDEESKG